MSPTIKLNDGASVPWVAFGTGTALYGSDASSFVTSAIQHGVTHLDGAQMYANEDSLGQGIKASGKPRSSLYITTKLHELKQGETVRESLVASLKNLDLDYVDLFLIHVPTAFAPGTLKSVWKQFEEVKKEGLAKSIGVSNFTIAHLQEILDGATIIPAVNQIEYHPYVFKQAVPLAKFSQENGIVVASYGGLTPVRNPGGPLDEPLETIRARLEKTRGAPVTAGQVLSKLYNQQGIIVVTTTSKAERIKEFLDVANIPDLTEDEIKTLYKAGEKKYARTWFHDIFGSA